MTGVRNLVLIKPGLPRTEADCEAEALRFLRSWKRAWERQALLRHGNDAVTINLVEHRPGNSR